MRINKNRILVSVLTLIYVFVYIWSYKTFLSPFWGYLGFEYSNAIIDNAFHFILIAFFCLTPVTWIPIYISRPSEIIYIILYFFTYIPLIVGISLSSRFDFEQILSFNLVMLFSFFLTGINYFLPCFLFPKIQLTKKAVFMSFGIALLFLFAFVLYTYKGNLRLISIFDKNLYDFRFSGAEIEKKSALVGYAILWLSSAFMPILLSYGLIFKKRYLILFTVLGQTVLYMTKANKAFVVSVVFMLFIYYLLKRYKSFTTSFIGFNLALTTLLALSQAIFSKTWMLIFFPFASIYLMRTVGVSSALGNMYYDFFQDHPYTYFSHVSGINKIVDYPYDEILGIVVGSYNTGNPLFNANSTFYITDGLASLGLIGIPIAAVLCSCLFHLYDSVCHKQNLMLSTLIVSYASLNFMNVSLFTSFISGGLFILMVFFYFLPYHKS